MSEYDCEDRLREYYWRHLADELARQADGLPVPARSPFHTGDDDPREVAGAMAADDAYWDAVDRLCDEPDCPAPPEGDDGECGPVSAPDDDAALDDFDL